MFPFFLHHRHIILKSIVVVLDEFMLIVNYENDLVFQYKGDAITFILRIYIYTGILSRVGVPCVPGIKTTKPFSALRSQKTDHFSHSI